LILFTFPWKHQRRICTYPIYLASTNGSRLCQANSDFSRYCSPKYFLVTYSAPEDAPPPPSFGCRAIRNENH